MSLDRMKRKVHEEGTDELLQRKDIDHSEEAVADASPAVVVEDASKIMEMYEALKAGPLYDAENGLWFEGMENGRVLDEYTSIAQNWDVLLQWRLGREDEAKKKSGSKNHKKFRHNSDGVLRWHYKVNKDLKEPENNYQRKEDQETGFFVWLQMHPRSGYYSHYKKCSSLNKDNDGVALSIREVCERWYVESRGIETNSEMLDILISEMMGDPYTVSRYERLKNSRLFDKEKGMWNHSYDSPIDGLDARHHASTHLLEVILLKTLGKADMAHWRYDKLLKSPLHVDNMFFEWKEPPGGVSDRILSSDQLLNLVALSYLGGK